MHKNTAFRVVFFICTLFHSINLYASNRVALVIGNNAYETIPQLNKAVADANAMAQVLEEAEFSVTKLENASYRDIVKSIDSFSRGLNADDVAVFFFAGHGVQLRSGNYILPVDVDAESESMVERTSYSLDDITFLLGKQKSGFQLIIIDACRDNPFPQKTRSFGNTRGLIPVEAVKGQMIMYSASRGQQALDRLSEDDENPNGVFTREFISKIKTPGVSALEIIRDVQDDVEKLAASVDHLQRPAVYNESRGNFYFFGQPKDREDPEKVLWDEVKEIGNLDAFDLYITNYPKGKYIRLARAYIAKLKNSIKPSTSKERDALKEEMSYWDEVKEANTEKSYQGYLTRYPTGFFASVAEDYIELLDTQLAIDTFEKYATAEDQKKLEKDKKLLALNTKKVVKEDQARYSLAKRLLRLDVPTF